MTEVTVVFADLTGSTGVFEVLGNVKATQLVTRLTDWIGKVCAQRQGRVVKNLGDGVLMVFDHNDDALDAVIEMQRTHTERIKTWPENAKMLLQVGLARGEVIEQDSDFFGDAVNLASRLCDLSGPEQIFGADSVFEELGADSRVRFRSLGSMDIRGRHEACKVYRVEWQNEILSDFFTVQAGLTADGFVKSESEASFITLSWLDVEAVFVPAELPVYLGRVAEAQFVVSDPRVSRLHAKVSWHSGKFLLEDVSSYGTWVRFSGNEGVVALRRQECVLLVDGEIALGAPFEDFTVPTVSFKFSRKIS